MRARLCHAGARGPAGEHGRLGDAVRWKIWRVVHTLVGKYDANVADILSERADEPLWSVQRGAWGVGRVVGLVWGDVPGRQRPSSL